MLKSITPQKYKIIRQRLIWEKATGWRHPKDESEWDDSYLTKEFFEMDKEKSKVN